MNSRPIDRISTTQATVFIINYVLGVGILTLPRTVSEKVKTPDVWISVILGGLIPIVIALIMVKLCERFPNKTIYQFSQEIIGKWLGSILSGLIIVLFLISSGYQVRVMADTIGPYLLQGTPSWAIIMPFLWIGLYLIFGGINAIARMLEIIFPITVIYFLVIMFLGFKTFEIDHLRPVLGMGIMPVLKGITATVFSYSGYEIILVIYMFMQEQHKAKKVVLIGILIPIIFYTVTVVMVVGGLSIEGAVLQTWPVITYFRSFEITGLIFERFDSLLIAIWIMQIFTSFIISYYAASLGLAQLFRKNIRLFYWAVIPIIFIVAMIPENINALFTLGDWMGKFVPSILAITSTLLLVISIVRGKHEKT
ncbi:GerAB/ArcD/ProY family transporter [Peribacillus alkalitolerans]|uniref:GerAB/ArcD/ProY family transporter n=1 Tax=Peribacillus alkalitolerans TaxID=1550385 RepID=UPI0013D1E9D3|nr:GerAB/ArcD/ProY family transporter [Peribacillus alkalitolerans]